MCLPSHRLTISVAVALVCLAVMTSEAQSQVASASIGKWKLNVMKSKFEPGPVYKSEMRTYEDWGGGLLHGLFVGVDGQDKPTYREYVARFDGKDYPWARKGAQTAWTIALKLVDPHTFEFIGKEDGKVSYTGTNIVSPDGKVMTITFKGTNAQGQPVGATMVYDKQ